ncbi:MAG: hypothetical protein LC776_08690 [Acidobacteria bacterium]|nr:hypothetical protein [Acidobacteriota bacterium]
MTTQDDSDKRKKWYTRVSFWVVGAILAGIAGFVSARVVSLLESGVEQIGQPLDIVAEPSRKCSSTARKVILNSPGDVPPEPHPDDGPPELHSYDPNSTQYKEWEKQYQEWVQQREQQTEEWEHNVGVIDGNETDLTITVTGKSDRPVMLQSLDIEVTDRRTPSRYGFTLPHGCPSAPVNVRYMSFDLDKNPPVLIESRDNRHDSNLPLIIKSEDGSYRFGEPPPDKPVTFPYLVSQTELEVFDLYLHTTTCDCSWRLHLHWISGGRSGKLTIDDNGQPFRTIPARDLIFDRPNPP